MTRPVESYAQSTPADIWHPVPVEDQLADGWERIRKGTPARKFWDYRRVLSDGKKLKARSVKEAMRADEALTNELSCAETKSAVKDSKPVKRGADSPAEKTPKQMKMSSSKSPLSPVKIETKAAPKSKRATGTATAEEKPSSTGNGKTQAKPKAKVKEEGAAGEENEAAGAPLVSIAGRPKRAASKRISYGDGDAGPDCAVEDPDEEPATEEEDEEGDEYDENVFEENKPKSGRKKAAAKKPSATPAKKMTAEEAAELPVLTQPYSMFLDMIKNTPQIADVAKRLAGRPIRVATMCSGTESPLLAMDMLSRAIQERYGGVKMEVEHVFSCEIEPFKQAYIERNFAPPVLFRDVRELGGARATTAYGAQVEVPAGVDLLVAGTSCVDYSNLNNEKKDLDDAGESGQTFRGMMQWIKKAQPPLVILENVCSAPWDKVKERFRQAGYQAQFMRLDTKFYYIPHTRTRVYLMATLQTAGAGGEVPELWRQQVQALQRPSSSTLEAFLLPSDDPRVHRAREDLGASLRENRKATDWARCESRHQRARVEEELGSKRPLTGWEEGGKCKLPDYAWHDWGRVQVDRVLDLMDIDFLRLAATGTDATHKTLVWNLSQNVDRTTGSVKPGICPCLTPSMVPYVTNRGGPLVGIEALSLQGIPVDDLLLTRESEDQMADLAGNAMTSTVVGACILSALLVGQDSLLALKQPKSGKAGKPQTDGELAGDDAVEVKGSERLTASELKLANVRQLAVSTLLSDAARSARMCTCEGRSGLAATILVCSECGATSCSKCSGRPEHVFTGKEVHLESRLSPQAFEQQLKSALPMCIKMDGFTVSKLAPLKPFGVNPALWEAWLEAATGLEKCEFFFSTVSRSEQWSVEYTAALGRMELHLEGGLLQWTVWAKSPEAPGPVRDVLSRPIARMCLQAPTNGSDVTSLFQGDWKVCLPLDYNFEMTVEGVGSLVDTWESRLGLQGSFAAKKRWSSWRVSVPAAAAAMLDADVAGTYRLLDKCAGAMGALHKKDVGGGARGDRERSRPLYLFQDPTRCGKPEEDGFVFGHSFRRLAYRESRSTVASLCATWRPTEAKGKQQVPCRTLGKWCSVDLQCVTVRCEGATISAPTQPLDVELTKASCREATAVLQCRVPLEQGTQGWGSGEWTSIPLLRSKAKFESIAWFTERLRLPPATSEWTGVALDEAHAKEGGACVVCAPPLPELQFVAVDNKVEAREDVQQAGLYEQALKRRPPAFVVQQKLENSKWGSVRIAVNVASLVHRSLAALPADAMKAMEPARCAWRLVQHDVVKSALAPLTMGSNKKDKPHGQPPNFKQFPLRPEQQRSLGWMLQQEASMEMFHEEEVEEAVLESLQWRAEGKATRPVLVRGGIVADQVGYGKTAITVGLIDAAPPPPPAPAHSLAHAVPVKATLVFAPPHLLRQWPREVKKFTGEALKMLVVNTVGDLNSLSISDVQGADLVVVATTVLRSDLYFKRLAELAGANPLPAKSGRHFSAAYRSTVCKLEQQVCKLKGSKKSGGGAAAVWKEVQCAQATRAAATRTTLANKLGTTSKRLLTSQELLGKTKKQVYKAGKAALAGSSESAEDEPMADEEEEEEEVVTPVAKNDKKRGRAPKPTTKKAGAPKSGRKKATAEEGSDDDFEMSVDEEDEDEDDYKPSKKSKGSNGKGSAHKTAREKHGEECADAWGLSSAEVEKSWEQMKCAPLELFHWARVVVDEFTYLNNRDREVVLNLKSTFRWCLSGTPPVKNFDDVKGVAAFLGVHLGKDEAPQCSKKEQTKVEKFHHFREMHTSAWHARRHALAQTFLDRFVRQNVAEIDEIPWEEHLENVLLPPAERAIYMELEHHLQSMEMKTVKAVKSSTKNGGEGDKEGRLREVLGASGSPEEALLKRCAHFDLEGAAKSAHAACEAVVQVRHTQLRDCEQELLRQIQKAQDLLGSIRLSEPDFEGGDTDYFARWQREVEACQEDEAGDLLREILAQSVAEQKPAAGAKKGKGGKGGKAEAKASKPPPEKHLKKASVDDLKWELRELTHVLRRIQKELVGRVRSLRYFKAVRSLQEEDFKVKCPACGKSKGKMECAVLSCCGHMGCQTCLLEAADRQECPEPKCTAAARLCSVVGTKSLGAEQSGKNKGGKFGTKLLNIVQRIQAIDPTERILVFVQFTDLMQKVADALADAGVKALQVKGSVYQKTGALDQFQVDEPLKKGDPRVLLLNLKDESASGANLTTANHAIFVHPLLTTNQQEFEACETQAIGRVRRYGQTRTVHLWRFLASDTIDSTIYEQRVLNAANA